MTAAELLEKARRQFFRSTGFELLGERVGMFEVGTPIGRPITLVATDDDAAPERQVVIVNEAVEDLRFDDPQAPFAGPVVLLAGSVDAGRALVQNDGLQRFGILAIDGHWFRWVRS